MSSVLPITLPRPGRSVHGSCTTGAFSTPTQQQDYNIPGGTIIRTDEVWVRENLPKVSHPDDIDTDVKTSSRSEAAAFLDEYDEQIRHPHGFMTRKPMYLPSELSGSLTTTFSDASKSQPQASKAAQVLHRDDRMPNPLYQEIDLEGCFAVLNDQEFASRLSVRHKAPTSVQRTRSRRYIAVELLEKNPPPRHLYKHDLESFFYVLCHLVCDSQTQIELWPTYQTTSLIRAKRALFATPMHDRLLPQHQGMADCISELKRSCLCILDPGPRQKNVDNSIIGESFLRILKTRPSTLSQSALTF